MKSYKRNFILIFTFLLIITPAFATQVVINSEDWRDVFTGLQYAAVNDLESFFVIDAEQGTELATRLGDDTDVLLITGSTQAMPGFKALIRSRGYSTEETVSRRAIQTNHDLALEAPTRNLIIIDDGYSNNAVSVASFARVWDASVVFASVDIVDLIEEKNPDNILVYGHIPRDIYEELEQFEFEIINNQDRFEDNFELIKKFFEVKPSESLVMTNGDFLEDQLITDEVPLLFIGRQQVPDEVINFIKDNSIRIATLVGNSLAPNAIYIKEETGISIFIKFARGRNEQQVALDLFPLPSYNPLIAISEASYDPTEQVLRVTYQNPGEIPVYFSASFTSDQGTYEDEESIFIESGSHKTISYEMPDPGDEVSYFVLYGPSPNSLDLILQGSIEVSTIEISDSSEIEIISAKYDTSAKEFLVEVENTGTDDVYVLLELIDVRIGPERVRVASETERISVGATKEIPLPADLSEQDLSRNDEIEIEAFYGEKEFSLVKFKKTTLEFEVVEGGFPFWLVGVIAVVALILIWFVTRKKKRPKPTQQYNPYDPYQRYR